MICLIRARLRNSIPSSTATARKPRGLGVTYIRCRERESTQIQPSDCLRLVYSSTKKKISATRKTDKLVGCASLLSSNPPNLPTHLSLNGPGCSSLPQEETLDLPVLPGPPLLSPCPPAR